MLHLTFFAFLFLVLYFLVENTREMFPFYFPVLLIFLQLNSQKCD